MSDIREIFPSLDGFNQNKFINIPLKILEKQVDAINRQKDKTEVFASIVTVSGQQQEEINNVVYLLPLFGNGYNYRYIEFSQPLDNFYPVRISAFQYGNTDFGKVSEEQGESKIYETLNKIFNDSRTIVVFNQLKSIGKTVRSWQEEREK